MTTSPTPGAPAVSDAQDWREKIARVVALNGLGISYQNAVKTADALLAGPIAEMQAEIERLRWMTDLLAVQMEIRDKTVADWSAQITAARDRISSLEAQLAQYQTETKP